MATDVPVINEPGLVRRGAAIVNTDRQAFEAFVSSRRLHKERENRIEKLESEVLGMRSDLSKILELLNKGQP